MSDQLPERGPYATTCDEWELGTDKPGDPVLPGPDDARWVLMHTTVTMRYDDPDNRAMGLIIWTWQRDWRPR